MRRAPVPEPVPCPGCGAAFRAALTGGRCPICDTDVGPGRAAPATASAVVRAARAVAGSWPALLLGVAAAANVAIAVLVTRAVP